MYIPAHFAADDGLVSELLTRHGAADLVTSTAQGLLATLLPFVYDAAAGEHGALLGHVARNNDQWRVPPIGEALVIVRGADTYISPAWYQSTAEHGRVVPTWNYITAHVYGRLIVHDDPVGSRPWCAGSRPSTRTAASTPGRWTTRRRRSSPGSCARSSGSSWRSPGSRPRPRRARTGRRPTSTA